MSVILTNYNHAHYLPEALQAFLDQTQRPFEIIVVDDGSSDNSREILEAFSRKDGLVRVVRNDRNRGAAWSANRGVDLATGEYAIWAAADDLVLPTFIERSVALLAQYPEAGMSCCDSAALDAGSGEVREFKARIAGKPRYFSPEEVVSLCRGSRFTVGNQGNTVVVKTSALKEQGRAGVYFLPELRSGCDFFPFNVIAFRYGICYVPETLAIFRMTPGSYSTSNRKYGREICKRMLELIYSDQYQDVRPMFKHSEILYRFEYNLILVVVANLRFRSILTSGAIRKAFTLSVKRMIWEMLPSPLKELCLSLQGRNRILLNPNQAN